jgi:hypothetical protein
MSWNGQKTPFVKSISGAGELATGQFGELQGKAIPATVISVDASGTIVTVKFEVTDPTVTFPQITCPVATDKYARAPLRAGDPGYVVPSDLYLGGVSGLGGGTATLDQPLNLGAVVFHPCGNTNFSPIEDEDKYNIAAPRGAQIATEDGTYKADIGPLKDPLLEGQKNMLRLVGLQQAADDAEARAKKIPVWGLYHNAGVVRVRLS